MQTIGERLEDARKKKGVSIRESAEATKIRGDYLQKFENNQFDIELSDIYVRGFLRNYANYLRLPADRILGDYASIAGGEPRPRQPSREVYGRMDLSISSADDRTDRAAQQPESGAAEPGRTAPQIPRGHSQSSLPAGPRIDPALVFKGGIAAVCVVAALLLYWIVKSLTGGGTPEHAAPPPAATAAAGANPLQMPAEGSFILVARGAVRVEVTSVEDGRKLFTGNLAAGQLQSVPKSGAVYIYADHGELLNVEIKGKRYPMPFTGYDRAELQ